ncbi:MAG: cytochrome c3 family protein [FCB group bacterium]|jgi:hypothetical protein|nr:cytochrome c3 family protein [FCB group bacterium]
MAQIFSRGTNYLAKASIVGLVLLVGGASTAFGMLWWSPYRSDVGVSVQQVVPFSHEHHVSGLGLDCRYCHTSVEDSSFAGIPPTHTCMGCHSQVWTDAPMLEPVRNSYRTNTPLVWNRVHDLADFAYFNHGIHIQKGIGCVTCHGQVDQMPLMRKTNTLFMSFCVDCHRDPAKYIRPKDKVFDMAWTPDRPQSELGPELVKQYDVQTSQLIDCTVCHR